jgi:hypothetical protein
MIYVIVEETGEYSSYNKDLMFASAKRDVIDAKLIEFENFEQARRKFVKEYLDLNKKYRQENPYPIVRSQKSYAEWGNKRKEWMKSIFQELNKKYNVNILTEDGALGGDRYYSIEEVESDDNE